MYDDLYWCAVACKFANKIYKVVCHFPCCFADMIKIANDDPIRDFDPIDVSHRDTVA